jgi:hypothetical protein
MNLMEAAKVAEGGKAVVWMGKNKDKNFPGIMMKIGPFGMFWVNKDHKPTAPVNLLDTEFCKEDWEIESNLPKPDVMPLVSVQYSKHEHVTLTMINLHGVGGNLPESARATGDSFYDAAQQILCECGFDITSLEVEYRGNNVYLIRDKEGKFLIQIVKN